MNGKHHKNDAFLIAIQLLVLLQLLCSTILHLWLLIFSANNSAVER